MKRRVKAPGAARAPRRSGTPRLAPKPIVRRRLDPDPLVRMLEAVWQEMRGPRFSSCGLA